MNDQLIIVGASGHGKVCADIAIKMNKWKTIAFLDDDEDIKEVLGLKVLGKSSEVIRYIENSDIFVAIGNNNFRRRVLNELEKIGASIPILIHPTSVIGFNVQIGIGTVIMANVVINCSTKIGKGCIINTSSTIDHDNNIGNYVHLSPGVNLAGSVDVGDNSWIGIGSKVINNLTIASNCIIGAGGVVVKDILESGTYVGVPVRRVLKNEENTNFN